MVREAMAAVLRGHIPGIRLMVVSTAIEALILMDRIANIDLVITDFYLPDMRGPQLIRRMVAQRADVPILVLSATEISEDLDDALASGAVAFVHKSLNAKILTECVKDALSGRRGMRYGIDTASTWRPLNPDPAARRCLDRLTPRQIEILRLLGYGLRNVEIASRLSTTEKNVKTHVSAILRALAVPNRTCAALVARQGGLIASGISGGKQL